MPLAFLTTLDGRDIPINEIDITRTIEDFGLPPADVAAVVRGVRNRDDVGPKQITASQIGSGARQLYLQDTIDYSREPKREMAALRGTMRHAVVNCQHEGLMVEERVTSKCGRYSARPDSVVLRTKVLRDAKFNAYYKVLMVLKHGVMKEARDYVFQLNMTAIILRQNGIEVETMWLDFEPQGVGIAERNELSAKFGIDDPTRILVEVPRLPDNVVLAEYQVLYDEKLTAIETGVVPALCNDTQTWGGKKCVQGWCPVAKQCHAIAKARGEVHPIDKFIAKAKPAPKTGRVITTSAELKAALQEKA